MLIRIRLSSCRNNNKLRRYKPSINVVQLGLGQSLTLKSLSTTTTNFLAGSRLSRRLRFDTHPNSAILRTVTTHRAQINQLVSSGWSHIIYPQDDRLYSTPAQLKIKSLISFCIPLRILFISYLILR